MLKIMHRLILIRNFKIEILNSKLVIILEYQNTTIFLLKDALQTSLDFFFVIKIVKNTVPWTYVISDVNGEIVWTFYEKEL